MKGSAQDIMYTLIDVVNQSCQVAKEGNKIFCCDMALSAYEDAFSILEVEGYAKRIQRGKHRGKYELAWEPKFIKRAGVS